MKSLAVYCASSDLIDPAFHGAAEIIGAELARRNIALVYGGGGVGLMGVIARAVRAGGGTIVGVITETLKNHERAYDGCDELIVVPTMRERKGIMMQRGDGFLVLPGGVGTYEEFFEVLAGRIVGEHEKPIGLLNGDGYFNPLLEMIGHGVEHQFIQTAVWELVHVAEDPRELVERVSTAPHLAHDADRFMPTRR